MKLLARYRRRGRHRGYFPPFYRSVEAFAEAERRSAEFVAMLEADLQRDLARMHRRQIEQMLGISQ